MRAGNFLLLPLYTALLTAEDYGAYSIVIRTVGVLVPLAVLGQTSALLRLSVDAKDRYKLLETVVAWVAMWSLVVMVASLVAWPLLGDWIGLPLWPLGAAGVAMIGFRALFNLSLTWLQSEHRAAEHTRLSVQRWGVLLIGVLVLVLGFDLGALGILIAMCISFGVGALWGLRRTLKERKPAFHADELGPSLRYGIPFVPHAMASVVLVATDQVLLAAHDEHGLGAAGIYALGANLASAVFMLAVGMQTAWAPFFLKADRDREKQGWEQVRKLSFFSMAVVACGAVGMGLMAPEAVWLAGLYSGTDWSAAAAVVPVLAVGALARAYYTTVLTVLMANKRFARWVFFVSMPAALFNGWLNLLWIPDHGLQGAAWATSCSWGLTALVTAIVARFARPVPFKYLRAGVLMALVIGTLQIGTGTHFLLRVGLGLGFAGAVLALDYRDLMAAGRSVLRQRSAADDA